MVNSPIPVHRRRYSNELKKHISCFREKLVNEEGRRFKNKKLLMNSSNGTLYSALDDITDSEVILKKIDPTGSTMMTMKSGDRVPSEIYFHHAAYAVCPEHVVQPLDYYSEMDGSFVLAMERPVGYDDLLEVCQQYAPIDEKSSFTIVEQLAQTCQTLHQYGIVHGDVKLENTLMNLKTLQIKLIDFGSAMSVATIEKKKAVPASTPRYQPPEYMAHGEYLIDETLVWSLGTILYILLVGEWCYDEEDEEWVRDRDSEEHLSTMAAFLIGQTLNYKRCLRISSSGLLQMLAKL